MNNQMLADNKIWKISGKEIFFGRELTNFYLSIAKNKA